ncbi:hypothetical protein SAMN02745857_00977 [Andreprevotia lacus DSM 23236]|uniref:Lipoprotein n=1 Tax=Andreprevotia lacus DSM 23236 TaxID=1121001 RepID=A0A1W1XA99_9NEIS|nr:hypothetical protein [Andreprevotia lacus]SMC20471.1 hypothetical protein SAMN02745857_00977 [Andreprevotia lacus DSM 23236]
MKWIALLCLTSLLLACGDKEHPAKIAQPQRDALEKAKGVDQTVQKAAEDQNKQADGDEKK